MVFRKHDHQMKIKKLNDYDNKISTMKIRYLQVEEQTQPGEA